MRPEDIANRDMTAMDVVKGFGKGAARSVVGMLDLAAQSRMFPGLTEGLKAARPAIDANTTAENAAQEVGGYMETGAEMAVPVTRLARAVPSAVKAASAAAGPAVRTAGGAALDVATGHPLRAAGKVLGFILDAAKPAAKAAETVAPRPIPRYTNTSLTPAEVPAGGFSLPPARPVATPAPRAVSGTGSAVPASIQAPGGFSMPPGTSRAPVAAPPSRLVTAKALPVEEELAAALAEAPAAPMPRVTTPPPADLPPGYVPRTTAPKLKAAPKPEPAPAAPPKRAYFLKPEAEAAATSPSPTPSGTVAVEDLPAAWQNHVGQDIFPLTGKEGEAVAAELVQTLRDRGLSVSEAMMAVSKNKDIPVQMRQQLLKSLSRVKVK
jgi:hypothetical protein